VSTPFSSVNKTLTEISRIEDGLPQFLSTGVIALHMEDGEYVEKLPKDFYSSNAYGSKMVEYLTEWKKTNDGSPFFGYYPFSAPHWPLQAPKEYIDHYRGLYDEGPDALRRNRLRKLVELGLIEQGVEPHPVVAPDEIKGWEEMTDFERQSSARAMEAYAGMVEVSGTTNQEFVPRLIQ
jgi:arylsulfatase A-like enzyme